jgi:endothelin-converting enzyme/putative endopeptidase
MPRAMRKIWLVLAVPLLAIWLGRTHAKAPPAAAPGIDESALDPAVSPCDDFYHYACGGWLARTEIPSDRPEWSRGFTEIHQRSENELKKILEDLVAGKKPPPDEPYGDKLADFYAACMDEAKVEATAGAQLQDLLKGIDGIGSLDALAKELARQHLGVSNALFTLRSQQDFANATEVITLADQGGLGLPDRDYYLKDDPRFAKIRARYEQHVANMLRLAGASQTDAARQAQTVLRIERALAEASLPRVDRRDPRKIYHRIDLAGLKELSPRFPWALYLKELGHPGTTQMNVAVPPFFSAIDQLLQKVPLADWKIYLRWHLLKSLAPALSKPFVDENFDFYSRTLQGIDKNLPRWKRCVHATDHAIGHALARPFVRLTFGAEGKAETQSMVKAIEAAMEANLKTLPWMDEPTRKKAFEKLHAILNKIGYPEKWRNYDALTVDRDSYVMNQIHAAQFETRRDLAKIGKPVDRTDWEMTPPTVNAYYEPQLNQMVFPAGILQPPFYSHVAPPAVNEGAIGMVMGHELTHGFDDQGRKFDAKGNLADWWTPSVGQEFDKRAQCVVDQFSGYTVYDQHLNGKLTLGENIADLGGLKLAHAAYVAQRKHREPATVGAFSDEQLFFLGYAQGWCGKRREALSRLLVTTDPHSPPEYRVNGPLSNLPEFASAFHCPAASKMVRPQPCAVW